MTARPLIEYPDEEIAEIVADTKAGATMRVRLPDGANVFVVDRASHLVVMHVSVVESTCDLALALLARAKRAETIVAGMRQWCDRFPDSHAAKAFRALLTTEKRPA